MAGKPRRRTGGIGHHTPSQNSSAGCRVIGTHLSARPPARLFGALFWAHRESRPKNGHVFFCLAPCQAIRALRATRAPPEGSWGGGFTAFCGFLKHPHQGGASHTASALTQSVSEVLEAMKLALRLLAPTPSLECQFLEISICVSLRLFRTSPVIFVVSVLCK